MLSHQTILLQYLSLNLMFQLTLLHPDITKIMLLVFPILPVKTISKLQKCEP
jgi:hypothetical protein